VAAAWDSASGRRGGGYLEGIPRWQLRDAGEEEILRRSRGGGLADGQVLLAAAHIRRQLRAGAAGCYTVAQSRWLPFIGDEIRDC
jgi:hypothetical protein